MWGPHVRSTYPQLVNLIRFLNFLNFVSKCDTCPSFKFLIFFFFFVYPPLFFSLSPPLSSPIFFFLGFHFHPSAWLNPPYLSSPLIFSLHSFSLLPHWSISEMEWYKKQRNKCSTRHNNDITTVVAFPSSALRRRRLSSLLRRWVRSAVTARPPSSLDWWCLFLGTRVRFLSRVLASPSLSTGCFALVVFSFFFCTFLPFGLKFSFGSCSVTIRFKRVHLWNMLGLGFWGFSRMQLRNMAFLLWIRCSGFVLCINLPLIF